MSPLACAFALVVGSLSPPSWQPLILSRRRYGVLKQFNPTKLVIDCAAAVGLVTDRKRATGMWAREKAKRAAAAKEQ